MSSGNDLLSSKWLFGSNHGVRSAQEDHGSLSSSFVFNPIDHSLSLEFTVNILPRSNVIHLLLTLERII